MVGLLTVPVIDLSSFEERKGEITQQLMSACESVGFLQVTGHSIPPALIDNMFAASARFFALPKAVKQQCEHDASKNVGFESYSQVRPSTGLPDNKESYQIGFVNMEGRFPSEEACPGFEDTAKEFQWQCYELSMRLLSCFATGLGFPEDFFLQHHNPNKDDSQLTLRCLHYPAVDVDAHRGSWRAGSHTDFDTLTLLFQRLGQGGLEVCGGRSAVTDYGVGDDWTPVEPCENAITVNIGDLLMRWSDDVLKSNFHRVRMPSPEVAAKPRYSIAFFAQPNRSSLVQGLKKKYPPITAGEYITQAVKPQFEASKRWAEAQAEALRTGQQATPLVVVTSQAAIVA